MIPRLTAAERAAFERATRVAKPKPDGGLARRQGPGAGDPAGGRIRLAARTAVVLVTLAASALVRRSRAEPGRIGRRPITRRDRPSRPHVPRGLHKRPHRAE